MARVDKVVDDITGEEGARTRTFSNGEHLYDIDLTDDGWEQLQALLQPYVDRGQRGEPIKKVRTAPLRDGTTTAEPIRHTAEDLASLRQWCAKHGVAARESGRLPADIWSAWENDDVNLLRPGRIMEVPKGRVKAQVEAKTA